MIQRYRADIGGDKTVWPIVVPDIEGQLVYYHDYRHVESERDALEEQATAGTLDPQRITDLIRERDDLTLRLERIADWCDAYPLGFAGGIFDEPDMAEVQRMLGPDLLTKLSAQNFRHVLNGVKKIAAALEGK